MLLQCSVVFAAALVPCVMNAGQEPPALPALSNSSPLKTHPLSPQARGDIFMARKMYREAIDMYRKSPQDASTFNRLGIAFAELSSLDAAKKNYKEALKLDPNYAEALNNVGTVYYAERFYKEAIVYYKRAMRKSPEIASVYANLGAAYFARHDFKRAAAAYEQAFRLDPEVLDRNGSFGTRMQQNVTTDLADFHLYLAKSFAKRGLNDRAIVYLRKALEEGIRERKRLPEIPEFSTLRNEPAFQELLAQNPKPL